MYSLVKVRVRSGSLLTDYINCTAGVKQGDVCSPILFSIFINELAVEIINKGKHGISMEQVLLFILLLADDIVLLSETVVGLQNQLNTLYNSSESLGLRVNMDKSNIIVFRKGGYLAVRERWFFNGLTMPVVNIYKYLGVFFTTKLSFTAACKDLGCRAKNALLAILRKMYTLDNSSFQIYMKLFDSQVLPILLYGAEIWGLDNAALNCEKVHLFALKKYLKVEMRTPNDMIYGETGRYPIMLNGIIKCIRYWLKLVTMPNNRLPRKAYILLHEMDAKGKSNWVSNIRKCLFQYGFGYVWMNQGVGSVNRFLSELKVRLVDNRWQDWNRHITESERFNIYSTFIGESHSIQTYLLSNLNNQLKYVMTRFRLGISDIRLHKYRYKNCSVNCLSCPLCGCFLENEVHFVFTCSFYDDIRKQLIPPKYIRNPCLFTLSLLMASKNHVLIRKFALFLYKALKIRDTLLS